MPFSQPIRVSQLTEAQSNLLGFLASRILASKPVHHLVTLDFVHLVDRLNGFGVYISDSTLIEHWLRVWRRSLDFSLHSRWYTEVTIPMQCELKRFLESRNLVGSPVGDYYTLMPVTGQLFNSFRDEWSGSEYNHTGPWSILEMISWWKGAEWVFLRLEYYNCIACKGSYCKVLFSKPNIVDANEMISANHSLESTIYTGSWKAIPKDQWSSSGMFTGFTIPMKGTWTNSNKG